jgi:tetratricopeptide (TPR) repeat protein
MIGLFRAWSLRQSGNRARDAQDWATAKAHYAAYLKIWPRSAAIWVQYGHAAKQSGQLAEAETAYRRAVSLAPSNIDTNLQLGHILDVQGQAAEAEQAFRRAVDLAPDDGSVRQQLGNFFKDNNRLAEAAGVYRDVLALDPANETARYELNLIGRLEKAGRKPKDVPFHIRYMNIGTVGRCNASCRSCPSSKDWTEHTPKYPMPMALFEKLIRGIVDLDIVVTKQISFGLFGDSLIDPHVVERAKLVRELIPDAHLIVNTNGAAYNREKHKELFDLVSFLAVHVESLDPETYHQLMAPLRAERVYPKIDMILEDFRGKVLISTPVSKLNVDELPSMQKHFLERGVVKMECDPISSRCAEDQTVFRELALDPVLIQCPSEILDDVIIDCDGLVLVCCQDFLRLEPVGNLATQSLAEVLNDVRRVKMRERFESGRHAEVQTCRRCYADPRAPSREFMQNSPLYQADRARDAGDWARAKELYGVFLAGEPSRSDIWVQFAHACKNTGDMQAADEAYRKATVLNPGGVDGHIQLGDFLKGQGRHGEAGAEYDAAFAAATGLYGDATHPVARQTIRQAEIAKQALAGNWSAVAEARAELVGLQPKRAELWVQYAHAAKESGDFATAETAYREAAARAPADPDPLLHLAHMLKNTGRREDAADVFAALLALKPDDDASRRELEALRRIEAPPPSAPPPNWLARADAARDARDWPAARTAYAEVLAAAPYRADIWVQYGHAAKESGDGAEAETAYRRALAIDDRNADTWLQLGHLYKIAGRREGAEQAYRRASECDPSLAVAERELTALTVVS